ncbi:MAG TPA: hypothetical protein VFM63_03570 [Pyrinomonadaceae bacterium]|nr:hypothetical protein [Pyrinomonadaceae bacterium]
MPTSVFSVLFIVLFTAAISGHAQTQVKVDRRVVSPNRVTPELYSDNLTLKITLMNLPGAANSASYLQVEYKVYFVAEAEFEKTMRQLKSEGKNRELKPEYFPNKTLLVEGKVDKRDLKTLAARTFVRDGIEFKRKVPNEQQTIFANLLAFYSVKVYDGELKKDVYQSGVFVTPPFDTDSSDQTSFSPRSHVYLNFFVSPDGTLYRSNRKAASETSEWKPN